MYPFERFTESSKQMLTLAQREAERCHHSYIGTEHLLLAMTSQSGTIAAEALHRLGVTHDDVRSRIDSLLGRSERIMIQQIIPTSRVKTVIEKAFEEAKSRDSRVVSTGHLLVAIALEGQNVAAQVLTDMGATFDALRATITAVEDSGFSELSGGTAQGWVQPEPPSRRTLSSPLVRLIVSAAAAESLSDAVTELSIEHVLRAIVKLQNERITRVFASLGIDEAQLVDALTPSQALVTLRRSLQAATAAKQDAVAREDYTAAETFRRTEDLLRREVEKAEAERESPPQESPDD